NKIPIGQNERLAKFGTVVESCSKKVAVSSVWAFADTPACPAWILSTMRRYFSLYYLLRTARQIWQSSPEFLFVFSQQNLTKTEESVPFCSDIRTVSKNAKLPGNYFSPYYLLREK
ncbi:hypothetical protein AALB53_25455, partial [Lachnospiraceae bacterium 47-T17]